MEALYHMAFLDGHQAQEHIQTSGKSNVCQTQLTLDLFFHRVFINSLLEYVLRHANQIWLL